MVSYCISCCPFLKSQSGGGGEIVENDPCTGFPSTHKAKLSITSIIWNIPASPEGNPSSTRNETGSHNDNLWVGVLFTILASLAFSGSALLPKMLIDDHIPPFGLAFWSFFVLLVLATITILLQEGFTLTVFSLDSCQQSRQNILLLSFYGASAVILFISALQYLTVADVLVIQASSYIFAHLLTCLLIGKKEEKICGVLPVASIVLAISGAVLLARPPFLVGPNAYHSDNLVGVILSASSAVCTATAIVTWKLFDTFSNARANFWVGLFGIFETLLLSALWGVWIPVPTDILVISKIGSIVLLFGLGQTFTTSFQHVVPITALRHVGELGFIFTGQLLFLGVIPDSYSCVAATLVLVGVVLTALRNWIYSTKLANAEICGVLAC